jgi:hypothetical protein
MKYPVWEPFNGYCNKFPGRCYSLDRGQQHQILIERHLIDLSSILFPVIFAQFTGCTTVSFQFKFHIFETQLPTATATKLFREIRHFQTAPDSCPNSVWRGKLRECVVWGLKVPMHLHLSSKPRNNGVLALKSKDEHHMM